MRSIAHPAPEPARLHSPEELVDALAAIGRDYAASCRYVQDIDVSDQNWALNCRRNFYHRLVDEVCFTAAILTLDAEVLTW